jgi:hypothetical protein
VEKNKKFVEKGKIEVLMFKLKYRMREKNKKKYKKKEGKMI